MTTDERRSRLIDVIASQLDRPNVFMGGPFPGAKRRAEYIYDAIRESDEAAGMVLVPKEATEQMLTEGVWDISPWHPAYDTEEGRRAAMRDAWNGMIAAATEADHG